MSNLNKNVIQAYAVYYRRDGKKRVALKNNLREVADFKTDLFYNKRKFLGSRLVRLAEVN